MKNIHFDEVSDYTSWPPNYSNHTKNNKKGTVLNTVILVTVEEDVVGFQGHHDSLNLEGNGDV